MDFNKLNTKKETNWPLVLLMLVLTVPSMLWFAYVSCTLWVWFIVPFGLPVVSIAQMMGASLTIKFILLYTVESNTIKIEEDIDKVFSKFIGHNFGYLFVLGIGWVILQFV